MNTPTTDQMTAMCDAWADVCRIDREIQDQGKVVQWHSLREYMKAVAHYQRTVADARTDIGDYA